MQVGIFVFQFLIRGELSLCCTFIFPLCMPPPTGPRYPFSGESKASVTCSCVYCQHRPVLGQLGEQEIARQDHLSSTSCQTKMYMHLIKKEKRILTAHYAMSTFRFIQNQFTEKFWTTLFKMLIFLACIVLFLIFFCTVFVLFIVGVWQNYACRDIFQNHML